MKEDSWWSDGRLVGGGDRRLRESAHKDEKRSGFQAKRPDRPSCGLHRRQIKVSGLTRWLVWACGGREGELARWSPACVARRWQPRGNFHREGDSTRELRSQEAPHGAATTSHTFSPPGLPAFPGHCKSFNPSTDKQNAQQFITIRMGFSYKVSKSFVPPFPLSLSTLHW